MGFVNLWSRRKKLNSSVYSVLLIYFLAILLFMSIFSLIINKKSSDEVKQENIRMLSERSRNYFNTFEDNIENIIILQQEYVNSQSINYLAGRSSIMTPYEKIVAVKDIESRLSWLTSYSDIVSETSVYIPNYERIISGNTAISEVDDQSNKFLLESSSYTDRRIIGWEDNIYVILPYPQFKINNVNPDFILYLKISDVWIREQLNQFTELPSSMVAVSLKEYDLSLASNNNIFTQDELEIINEELSNSQQTSGEIMLQLNNQDYVIVYQYSQILDMTMYIISLEDVITGGINTYRNYIILLGLFIALALVFYTIVVFRIINYPLKQLVNGLRTVEQGNLEVHIQTNRNDEFGYVIKRFNRMCERLKDTIHQVYEEKIHVQQAEMKQLQYQINPHFLYNSLYMIRRMAKLEDYENIDAMSRHLSRYYEYITHSDTNRIELKAEMNHAIDYLNIQCMRFGERVKVEYEQLPAEWENCIVPRLILQPILENCYKYGVESMVDGGIVRIKFKEDDGYLYIYITNNGNADLDKIDKVSEILQLSFKEYGESSGIVNVHRRLKIMYGLECGLTINRTEDNQTVVMLKIKNMNQSIVD